MNNRQTHSKGDIVFHIFNTLLMILILISIGLLRRVDPDGEGGGLW